MNGFKISFAIVAFVLVQGIAVIWYISKLDSKVNTMYTSFEEENRKEVIENQLKKKLDLANLVTEVSSLKKDLKKMRNKDKEIMEQHGQIFELLQDVTTSSTGSYSYD